MPANAGIHDFSTVFKAKTAIFSKKSGVKNFFNWAMAVSSARTINAGSVSIPELAERGRMKFFIAEMTYLAPIETIREGYAAHRAWLQKGYDLGLFLCSGPKSDPPVGGYLVARAKSKAELEDMFAHEPFNKAGLGAMTFTEFQPVKRASWAETWFNGGNEPVQNS